ncbi:MAG: M3 family metallopeptidase [Bryobacterales bacterium]
MPELTTANPLAEIQFRIPFDQIRAEHVEPAIDALLAEAQQNLDELIAGEVPRTFANTLLALERVTEKLEYAMGVAGHLESVATYPELRKAYNNVQPKISAFFSSIPLNEALWKKLQEFAATPDAAQLAGTRARFLKKTVDEFRRSGADLDPAGKKRLMEINVELAERTTTFSEHVLDATNAFELVVEDESKLAGLPASAVEVARDSAEKKGKAGWRFTLQGPSFTALMTYLDDRGIREQIYRAYNKRATEGEFDNREIIGSILALRNEKAKMLGYENFADLVLEDRMAKNGRQAQEFVDALQARTQAAFTKENEELESFRRELEGPAAPPLEPWDVGYYAEKLRRKRYDFDEEQLRPYFPFEGVLEGMFEIVGRLYGVKVKQQEGVPAWDSEVKYYSLYDNDSAWFGSFYADFYPRENKRGGAWMDSFITGEPAPEGFKPHLGLICGNQTPPVGGKPSLLTHREVETIFHEFGHLLHHLLSRVEIRSLAGTRVAWDFVELPSQIMENWCWERDALDLFARHYQTGETIPGELFEKMKRARNFRAANAQMRQLGFAALDLALHTDYSPQRDGDVMSYSRAILQKSSPVKLLPDHGMLAGFSHLFASPVGYGAGYYSYKWAEVLDADAFTRFAREGIFSSEVGRAFREAILSRGDSDEPADLFRCFMGRDPDPEALMLRLGLA